MSNLSDFLKENGIAAEAVVERSTALEKLDPDGRTKLVARQGARRNKKTYAEVSAEKPSRLGRGVTLRTLEEALSGGAVPRIGRKKIFKAVNSILVSQKKSAVDFRVLFNDAKPRVGKSKK